MKPLHFIISYFLTPSLIWAQSGSFTVNGNLPSVKAPAKAYLRYKSGPTSKMDSALIQNGKFSFKGTIDEPTQASLLVDKTGAGFSNRRPISSTSLYLESGTIAVTSPDSLENSQLSGTSLNVAKQKLATLLKATNEKVAQISKDYAAATPEQKQSKEFMESLNKRYEAVAPEQKKIKAQFIKENPTSLVSLFTLQQYDYSPDYGDVAPLFEGLSNDVKNSTTGKEYAKLLSSIKATAIGAMAPEFTQADTLGKAVSLNSFRGKYVLIDFWASWCGPCRQENPNVVKNFHEFKDKNFTVLGVSLDRPNAKEAWLNAIHKDGLTWTHVSDLKFWENDVARQYGIRSIPQNFLLDPSGKIIAKNIRGEELGKKLAEFLNVKP